ncbi:hypothetical protein V6N13_074205 [Hibiscus sabdariffa]
MGKFREKEWRWENLGKGILQKQSTIFISNLPPRFRWQGLWFAFARHGEVIDAFIPAKKSKRGIRYGFVRFINLEDAEKAIDQKNGSVLYGCQLTASLARFSDNLEDRTNKQVKNRVSKNVETTNNQSKCIGERSSESCDSLKKPCRKRILGHVEEEAIRKLKKCLVGTMATVCSTSQVEDRLQTWGLNDVTVKYMGGCKFLIGIKDQELSSRLQIQEWAILKEIFTEVETWTNLFHLPERITWIQARAKKIVNNSSESSLDFSPHSVHSTTPTNDTFFNCNGEDEVTKAICLKKASLINVYSTNINERRSLGEKDFLGNAQSVELPLQKHLEIPISMQVFNEAVCRDFNANSPKELGPPALLNRPTLRWADVVANNQGRAQQEASASWAHTIDLVNNQSITDFLEEFLNVSEYGDGELLFG